jgi:hypothetical protein
MEKKSISSLNLAHLIVFTCSILGNAAQGSQTFAHTTVGKSFV